MIGLIMYSIDGAWLAYSFFRIGTTMQRRKKHHQFIQTMAIPIDSLYYSFGGYYQLSVLELYIQTGWSTY